MDELKTFCFKTRQIYGFKNKDKIAGKSDA